MTSPNFVKSLRESMVTLSCLACVVFAGMGLVSRANAQSATGKATITYALTGDNWTVTDTEISDDGGNYSSIGPNPFNIVCTVDLGDLQVASRAATLTIVQTYGRPAGTTGDLVLKSYYTTYATIGSLSQIAKATAQHGWSLGTLSASLSCADANANSLSQMTDSHHGSDTISINPLGIDFFQDTAKIFASAAEPVPVGFEGGGL